MIKKLLKKRILEKVPNILMVQVKKNIKKIIQDTKNQFFSFKNNVSSNFSQKKKNFLPNEGFLADETKFEVKAISTSFKNLTTKFLNNTDFVRLKEFLFVFITIRAVEIIIKKLSNIFSNKQLLKDSFFKKEEQEQPKRILDDIFSYETPKQRKELQKRIKKIKRRELLRIAALFFALLALAELIAFLLKRYGYIDLDLLDKLLYNLGYINITYLNPAISNFIKILKEIFGIEDLENRIGSKFDTMASNFEQLIKRIDDAFKKLKNMSTSIKNYAMRLRTLEKKLEALQKLSDTFNELLLKVIGDLKNVITGFNTKLNEVKVSLEISIEALFTELKKKYPHNRGVALEQGLKELQKNLQAMRDDVEKVISLEHKNLSEKFKKYLQNLREELKSQLQIDEKMVEQILKKLLEASTNNVIDTTLADPTETIAQQ